MRRDRSTIKERREVGHTGVMGSKSQLELTMEQRELGPSQPVKLVRG